MKNRYRKSSRNLKFGAAHVAIGSIVIFLLAFTYVVGQDISIEANVDRTQVGLGESIELTISLSGPVRSIDKPDLPNLSQFDVFSSGTSSNISIVPGSMSYRTDYSYVLVPRKVGKFKINPVKVDYKGTTYSTKTIDITVVPQTRQNRQAPSKQQSRSRTGKQAGAGEDFFIEQTIDNDKPYIGQQVTIIFKFYQAQNLFEQPSMNWPDFKGFWVEDLPPNKTYNKQVNGKTYRVTEIRRALFPTVTGKIKIEPAILSIPPSAFNNIFNDPFDLFNRRRPKRAFSEKTLKTKGITLNVKPLPQKNKPDGFSGATGKYKFRLSLDNDTVMVDQPITLKAVLSGTGNIKKLPAIEIPELENFRLYDSGSHENISKDKYKVTGSKSFEWVLIPTAPGEYELPNLSFSYYDPLWKRYYTLSESPGRIFVAPSSVSSLAPGDRPVNLIPAARTSLNYIITELADDDPSRPLYKSAWIWLLQILPIGWLVYLTIVVNQRKRLEGDIAYARRKQATKAARGALKNAREGFDSPGQFYGHIFNGIVGFISDKLNVNAVGLTNNQLIDLLKNTGKCDDFHDDFLEFLNRCDAGRFSPIKPDESQMKEIYNKAEQLLSQLDRSLN
ncbi:MAG: protein BatD [candidate division Zixibacteria bacterium]|nr:protein BatD [candidate division Zixibacteria bacterium]